METLEAISFSTEENSGSSVIPFPARGRRKNEIE
jgi:hypothetical protein